MPRGSRRVSLRDNLHPFQRDLEYIQSMEQRYRRAGRRESSEERRTERERSFARIRLARAARETPESLRVHLYEDPSNESSQRDAGTNTAVRFPPRRVQLHERQRQQQHGNVADWDQSSQDTPSDQPSRDLQRRFTREPPPRRSEALPSFASLTSAASLPPLRYLGTRRGWNNESTPGGPSGHTARQRADRILERERTLAEQRPVPANPPSFEDLEPLEDANTHLRALLEYTNNTVMAPPRYSTSYHGTPHYDRPEDARRVKRRKLDPERQDTAGQSFRYGKYGQVETGQLKLEIETCDGGVYGNQQENPPENILKNDDSVYCTKQNRCNIVLRHQGSTVFTLAEIVLKAPGPQFSSPVREGMVFVSMESDEIFTRTSQYQVQFVSNDHMLKREDRTPIVSIRHHDDGITTRYSRSRRDRMFNTSCLDALEYKTAVFPVEPLHFPYTIATDRSDTDDSTHDYGTHRSRTLQALQPPNRIGTLAFESDSSEDGENILGSWRYHDVDIYSHTPPAESHRRVEDMTLAEAAEASQLATQEAVQAVGGTLLAPHAKFFIERGKNRCTIKFDPPVTGRYILLKMYHPTENIDIQGVYAKGFAGPRFFPSVELR